MVRPNFDGIISWFYTKITLPLRAQTFLSTERLDNLIEKKIQNLLFDISKKIK